MHISREQFEKWVEEAIDSLPQDFINKAYNVAFFVEDHPSSEQLKKVKLDKQSVLFGLYEGFHQASRKNVGAVLPDRITIFRKAITDFYATEQQIKDQIRKTIKHEVAHHFGSDENGARKASKH
jgi:predicted Zn-dependent protease with MMP-like domain